MADSATFRVELIPGSKHDFQDNDIVELSEIEGFEGGPKQLRIKEIITTASFLVEADT